ncbi:hypothetical protein CFE70_001244 [Pyrenophora teres f. teres 0-1]
MKMVLRTLEVQEIVGPHRIMRKSCAKSKVNCVNYAPFNRISASTSHPPVAIVRPHSSTYDRFFFAEQGTMARAEI